MNLNTSGSLMIIFLSIKIAIPEKVSTENQNDSNSETDNFKNSTNSLEAHSRQKRFVWISDDGVIAFPPGTLLIISPTLSMPFFRNAPRAFVSNLGINTAFTSMTF